MKAATSLDLDGSCHIQQSSSPFLLYAFRTSTKLDVKMFESNVSQIISENRPVTSQPGSCAIFGMATSVDGLGLSNSKIASTHQFNWPVDHFHECGLQGFAMFFSSSTTCHAPIETLPWRRQTVTWSQRHSASKPSRPVH